MIQLEGFQQRAIRVKIIIYKLWNLGYHSATFEKKMFEAFKVKFTHYFIVRKWLSMLTMVELVRNLHCVPITTLREC